MNRSDLAAIVNPLAAVSATLTVSDPLEDAIRAYLDTDAGKSDLANAPRINGIALTKEGAVTALLEEAHAMQQQAAG